MRQSYRHRVASLALVTLIGIGPLTLAQDADKDKAVDEIVHHWAQAGEKLSTLDVAFTLTERSPELVEPIKREGRLAIKRPDLAMYELQKQGDHTQPTHCVWNQMEIRFLAGHARTIFAIPRDLKEPRPWWFPPYAPSGELPESLSLPFLMSTGEQVLREQYKVELLEVRAKGTVLRLTPRTQAKSDFDRALILIESETYRPTAMRLVSVNGKSTKTFVYRDARYNEPIEDDIFQLAVPEGWKFVEHPR